jgi:8-oxo-dGTP diphosphatase
MEPKTKHHKIMRVVAALIIENNKILIGLRSTGRFIDFWEFPGGKVETDELPEKALIREIHEEFNLTLRVRKFAFNVIHEYDDFELSMDCYWCTVEDLSCLKMNDHSQIEWYDPKFNNDYRWLPADVKVVEKLREITEITPSI